MTNDRNQSRCRVLLWKGDNIAKGLKAATKEAKHAYFQAWGEWVGRCHYPKTENLKKRQGLKSFI